LPLRVLHISTRLIVGGSQENTVLSCEGQSRLGHKVHLAYGPIFGPEGSMLERIKGFNARCAAGDEQTRMGTPACPIILHEIPSLVRELSLFKDVRCRRELLDLITRLGPDVVHTHSSKAGILGRSAGWAAHRTNESGERFPSMRANSGPSPAVIHTIHGPPFMPVEGEGFSRLKIKIKNAIYIAAERYAAKRCHAIVCVADAMRDLFLSYRIGTPGLYTTVYSGMETEPFAAADHEGSKKAVRARLGLPDDAFVIGTVSRLAEHKGHDDILKSLGQQLSTKPNWRLLWVGDGWWRERLLAKARSMNISVAELDGKSEITPGAQMILTGLVPPDEVPSLMSCMDVLVHASYREGLPRTVPQALLSGVCPVAYDVDGTGEACRELETGRLVALGDTTKLEEAVAWCAENPVARRALAARGRAECLHRFSATAMVEALEHVYAKAMGATT